MKVHIGQQTLREFTLHNSYTIFQVIFMLWMSYGTFPLYYYESGKILAEAGCASLSTWEIPLPFSYSYEYSIQPLVYCVVSGLKTMMPFGTSELYFCILSVVAALLFVNATIRLVAHFTGFRRELLLLAVVFLPPAYAIGMYPNSAVFAAAAFTCGITMLVERKMRAALIWLCLAPLCRIRVLFLYPMLPFLFWWMGDRGKALWHKTGTVYALTLAVAVVGYMGMRANPFEFILADDYEWWSPGITVASNLYALGAWYMPINLVLMAFGIVIMATQREWRLMAIVLVPLVISHVVYARTEQAALQFLYVLPFVAIATSETLAWLERRTWPWRALIFVLLAFFVFDFVQKEQSIISEMPEFSVTASLSNAFQALRNAVADFLWYFGLK